MFYYICDILRLHFSQSVDGLNRCDRNYAFYGILSDGRQIKMSNEKRQEPYDLYEAINKNLRIYRENDMRSRSRGKCKIDGKNARVKDMFDGSR